MLGNLIGDYLCYDVNSGATTHTVGTKLPNELGLYDMSGNVWEWTWDWSGAYPGGAISDYKGVASGTDRVNRGGSWHYNSGTDCSVDFRYSNTPDYKHYSRGFRVVRP